MWKSAQLWCGAITRRQRPRAGPGSGARKSRRGMRRGGSVEGTSPAGCREDGLLLRLFGLLACDERAHFLLQRRQGHRAEVEDGVVERALVETVAQLALGLAAQVADGLVADVVGQRLAW